MRYTVDRINEGIAVLEAEDGSYISINIDQLPLTIREGSSVISENGVFSHDVEFENERRKKLFRKRQRLINRGINNF